MALSDDRLRLPPFRAREFALIGRAVNDLAGRLERAGAEKIALIPRLIEVRDDERKQMARELHDDPVNASPRRPRSRAPSRPARAGGPISSRTQGPSGRRKTYDD